LPNTASLLAMTERDFVAVAKPKFGANNGYRAADQPPFRRRSAKPNDATVACIVEAFLAGKDYKVIAGRIIQPMTNSPVFEERTEAPAVTRLIEE
jgi:hypothetical protein